MWAELVAYSTCEAAIVVSTAIISCYYQRRKATSRLNHYHNSIIFFFVFFFCSPLIECELHLGGNVAGRHTLPFFLLVRVTLVGLECPDRLWAVSNSLLPRAGCRVVSCNPLGGAPQCLGSVPCGNYQSALFSTLVVLGVLE